MIFLFIIIGLIFFIGVGSYGSRAGGRIGGVPLAEFPSTADFSRYPLRAFASFCENFMAWFVVLGGAYYLLTLFF